MGFLRLLLAFCVMSWHSRESMIYFFPPSQAVAVFFVISGFYMALILDGKYTSKIHFYVSRALRIYPLYWVALFTTVFLGIAKMWFHLGSDDNAILHYIKFSAHLTGINAITEATNYITRNLTLIISKDYIDQIGNMAPGYLVIYQAWSLQIELLFYLVVPFILKFRKKLLLVSILYCMVFYGIVRPFSLVSEGTITYVFMALLIYFLLGLCSYQYIYKKISNRKISKLHRIIFFVFITYIAAYQLFPVKLVDQGDISYAIFFLALVIVLPFIFTFTKSNRIDRFLGELSYPVYITHLIFVKILLSFPHPQIPFFNTFVVSVASISFSVIIVKFIQNPIDKFRHRRLRTKT